MDRHHRQVGPVDVGDLQAVGKREALRRWQGDWQKRRTNWTDAEFPLPVGGMQPIGYVVQPHGVRLKRPVRAYDRWVRRIPDEYRRSILCSNETSPEGGTSQDPHCLATLKHYRSLVPLGQEARKPIFALTVADGAIGAHALAVQEAWRDFETLARAILERTAPRGTKAGGGRKR